MSLFKKALKLTTLAVLDIFDDESDKNTNIEDPEMCDIKHDSEYREEYTKSVHGDFQVKIS